MMESRSWSRVTPTPEKSRAMCGADCDIHYILKKPFERIRRITGYLVGTTDRWNNAKQQELADRVTHAGGVRQ